MTNWSSSFFFRGEGRGYMTGGVGNRDSEFPVFLSCCSVRSGTDPACDRSSKPKMFRIKGWIKSVKNWIKVGSKLKVK